MSATLTDVVSKKPKPANDAPKGPAKARNGNDTSDHFERCRAYVSRMPPAISGSGGHNATIDVVRACAGFALDESRTLDILREYNQRCQPEWGEKELAHKASYVGKFRKYAPGYILDKSQDWEPQRAAARVAMPAPDNCKAEARDNAAREANEKPTAADPLRGLKHLSKVAVHGKARFIALASEPVNYTWQDIVVAFTICLIAGPPGEGKTSLLFLILAARLNTGKPVHLLRHEMKPAPAGQYIVLIEGEHGESSASRKVVKSVGLLGVDDGALDRLILVARRSVKLGSPEWQDVVKMIQAGLVSDIALDTIARVAPANPDSEQEQVAIFETVAAAIDSAPEDMKPTAWAVAHTRKNGSGTLADVSGSAQRTGQADTVLMLKADKSSGMVASVEVTFEKLREAPDEYPMPAVFVIGKDADGLPVLTQDKPVAAEADDRPLEQRIIDLLAIEPRTKSALMKLLKRSWADTDAALTVLFGEKRIQSTTVEIRGQDRKAFMLRLSDPYPT